MIINCQLTIHPFSKSLRPDNVISGKGGFILFASFFVANYSNAQDCESAKVTFIAVDENGEYIPNINFEIYE